MVVLFIADLLRIWADLGGFFYSKSAKIHPNPQKSATKKQMKFICS
jgi:hypothetical protein